MLFTRHVRAGAGRSTVQRTAISGGLVPFRPDVRWRARRPWGRTRQLQQPSYALGGSEGAEDREVAATTGPCTSSSSSSSSPTGDLLIASDTPAALALAQCVQLLLARNFEALVPYFSLDAVIKAVVTRTTRSSTIDPGGPVCFLDIMECQSYCGDPTRALFDSAAQRHLILNKPAQLTLISTLPVGEGRLVQRYLSRSQTGESVVLTFTIMRRPAHESQVSYSRMKVMEPWVLLGVQGEPASDDPVEGPAREHPPEAVLAAYLAAYSACDMDTAFRLTSPLGRAVAGGKSQFYNTLRSDPRYQSLLMHSHAQSVRRCHSLARTYVEVVRVTDAAGGGRLFCFVATLQAPHTEYSNCWMVDYVSVIEDERIMNSLYHHRGSSSSSSSATGY